MPPVIKSKESKTAAWLISMQGSLLYALSNSSYENICFCVFLVGVFCQLHVLTLYIMKDNVFNPVFISKILIKDVGKFFFKAFFAVTGFWFGKKDCWASAHSPWLGWAQVGTDTHTGSVKEKEFEGFYFQNHSYHLIRIWVQSK